MELKEKITDLLKEHIEEIVKIRRHIHQFPELSFKEYKTSAYICSILEDNHINYKKGYAGTGILGKIEGVKPGNKVIALRADMDALPIQEENKISYKSKNDGVMHACGHDVHVASLIGTAVILSHLKDHFEGTVLLVFQPGEEKLPGGARLMMEDGVFKKLKPDIVIGQHVYPELETGKVGFKSGMYMASTDEIYLKIKGQGGHAAMPHKLNDTVLIASHIVVAMQQIISRNANASIPSVLSFGKFIANGATNVIPNEVIIEGTFRTLNEQWRKTAHKKIVKLAKNTAEGMGAHCDVEIKVGYPFLVNDEKETNRIKKYATELLGNENIADLDIRMTAEDFAYFSHQYPSIFYRLGTKNEHQELPTPLHTSTFNIDEKALFTGVKTMTWIAMNVLKQNN